MTSTPCLSEHSSPENQRRHDAGVFRFADQFEFVISGLVRQHQTSDVQLQIGESRDFRIRCVASPRK
jgi:hypothetical protein